MPGRIESLIETQLDRSRPFIEAWIADALTIRPCDRERCEWGIRESYRAAQIDPPKRVVWVQSPLVARLAGPIAACILDDQSRPHSVYSAIASELEAAVLKPLGSTLDPIVESALYECFADSMDAGVASTVGESVARVVRRVIDSALRSSVLSAVDGVTGSALRSAIHLAVGSEGDPAIDAMLDSACRTKVDTELDLFVDSPALKAIRARRGYGFFGHLLSGWAARATFYTDELKIDLGPASAAAKAWSAVTRECGYWGPYREFCIASDRPTSMRLGVAPSGDPALHCEDGPSIAWGDEWSIYAIEGVCIPR